MKNESKLPTLKYGPVEILKGPNKGLVGLYDDDDEDGMAIVYLEGDLLCGQAYSIPHKYLKNCEQAYSVKKYVGKKAKFEIESVADILN